MIFKLAFQNLVPVTDVSKKLTPGSDFHERVLISRVNEILSRGEDE